MTDYRTAKSVWVDLHKDYPVGSLVTTRRKPIEIFVVVAHALDSADLIPHTVVLHPDEREITSIPSDQIASAQDGREHASALESAKSSFAIQRFADAQKAPVSFDRNRSPGNIAHAGAVVRHYKGGVYSILSVLGIANSNPRVLYVSHADGVAWLRPWSEFGDGRFDPSSETVLSFEEAGIAALDPKGPKHI